MPQIEPTLDDAPSIVKTLPILPAEEITHAQAERPLASSTDSTDARKAKAPMPQTEPTLDGASGIVQTLPILPAEEITHTQTKRPLASSADSTDTRKAKAPMPQTEPILDGASGIVQTLLVLPAEITHAQAASCLHLLLTAARAENRDRIVVDAAPLARFDSSALAVLIECRREALKTGQRFAVRGIPARLAELARLYGVTELLEPDAFSR